jgi:hypothetical protein
LDKLIKHIKKLKAGTKGWLKMIDYSSVQIKGVDI